MLSEYTTPNDELNIKNKTKTGYTYERNTEILFTMP